MIIVKLGGSVITNKEKLRSFRRNASLRLCKELRPARHELIIVHGAGSFGHILAEQADLRSGLAKDELKKLQMIAQIHRDVRLLNNKVLDCLNKNKLKGFSIPPYTVASFSSGDMVEFCPENFERLLVNQMLPVTFGDIVPDKELSFSICSGDLMMLGLARHFEPEKMIFVADVDGVFDKDPKQYPDAKLIKEITRDNIDSISATKRDGDVTGAMKTKLARMIDISRYCENCMILNGNAEGRLEDAVEGREVVSTRVLP